ncbi:tetratricopeptide repeat protein [Flavimarina sp. Hel_I_48]|uniref:tetratricopeptide repeat protein n=1 Tax=Flavimarina sp. Hel_I_48 TaxID=1392488 RepID=UPI0004DF9C75|nr:tetratricopeptide repeat protein [Flavimarina sp. Hel_I_48]
MHKLLFLIWIAFFLKAEAQKTSALTIADSLHAVGNYSQAIAGYSLILPKNESIYLKLARAQRARGTFGDALQNYEQASKSGKNTIASAEYGKLLITTAQYQKADSIFTELIDRYNNNPDFYYQRGRARIKIADDPQAVDIDTIADESFEIEAYIEDFEKAVALDSTHQKALYETAKFHLRHKNYLLVERLCKKALVTYPDNVEVISLLAQENFIRGFVSDAIPLFVKLLQLGQDSQFIYEKLGACYYKKRQYQNAISAYLKALNFSQEDHSIHANLAQLYNFTEDFENAEMHGKLAILYKKLPLDTNYYTLGNTYRIHQKWKKALENYNKVLTENQEYKQARYYRAVVADNYYEDKKEVLQLYEQFIEKYDGTAAYDPTLDLARERYKLLKREIFMDENN